jgi:hypothetical protein
MALRQGHLVCHYNIAFLHHSFVLFLFSHSTFFLKYSFEKVNVLLDQWNSMKILISFQFSELYYKSSSFHVHKHCLMDFGFIQGTDQLQTALEREVLKIEVISCYSYLLSSRIAGTKHDLLPCQLNNPIFHTIPYSTFPPQLYVSNASIT